MMYWLLYDIVDNKRRAKIVRLCKDYGLTRIQKSCFFGNLEKNKKQDFQIKLEDIVNEEDCICLIPVSKAELEHTKVWGTSNFMGITQSNNLLFV